MSDQNFVKHYNIPFEYQRKDRLVYCDLAEHTILRVLIAKETSGDYGTPGYEACLKPMIEEWYLDEEIPGREWMKRCYNKAFLEPQKAFNLLKAMQQMIGLDYHDTLEDYYESKRKDLEKVLIVKEKMRQRRREDKDYWIENAGRLNYRNSRSEIITASYYIREAYKNTEDFRPKNLGMKEYEDQMKEFTKEKILDGLLNYIESGI